MPVVHEGINAMNLRRNVIVLPPLLQRRLENAARNFLEPGNGFAVDFARTAGEPALLMPDSISWRVFKNPLALFVGGVAAVILELAEPRIRAGVWEHTTFQRKPLLRLQRTGLAAMVTVYGPRSQAEAMIAGVRRIHDRISGLTHAGQAYRANDPELLDWVHATASFGFLQAYNMYVRKLDNTERNSFYAESEPSARLYGALGAPTSEQELAALFEKMRHKLEPSPTVIEFLDIMRSAPILPLPRPLAAVQSLLVMAAIGIVPEWVRERLGLTGRWSPDAWQLRVARHFGAAADRILLRSSPAVQACRRMGLPDDYLYR
jgi:uncharacterized protein (DUF2236 family)